MIGGKMLDAINRNLKTQPVENNDREILSKLSYVLLETTDGETISIELLHAVETRVDKHVVEIKGSSYDIFATPNGNLLVNKEA
jgi:hypothetical protein